MQAATTNALNLLSQRQAVQVRPSESALPFSLTSQTVPPGAFTEALSAATASTAMDAAAPEITSAALPLPGTKVTSTPSAGSESRVSPEEVEKITKVSRDLESVLAYTLLKEMWSTLPKGSMLDSGLGSKFYREMWLEEISKRTSESGMGLGVADVVKRELMDRAKREVRPEELSALI
jgi:hypothetical protein